MSTDAEKLERIGLLVGEWIDGETSGPLTLNVISDLLREERTTFLPAPSMRPSWSETDRLVEDHTVAIEMLEERMDAMDKFIDKIAQAFKEIT